MFFLLVLAIAFDLNEATAAATKCEELRDQASNGQIGAFIPRCKADGSFEREQCWSSTGYCWCVDKYGVEIPGSKVRGEPDCSNEGVLTLCQKLQTIIVNVPGWCGPPDCKPDGSFEEIQCCVSTDECYCVDNEGKEIVGSRQKGKPSCFFNSSKCEKARQDALANGPLVGQFIPHCKEDGSYEPLQCWASTGYCWCVDQNGRHVDGSMVRFKRPHCE